MDFEITINGETRVYELHEDVKRFIDDKTAYWNNFAPEETLVIQLRKIPGQAETIGISVDEKVVLKDIFGAP
jgi:hypothetical protein